MFFFFGICWCEFICCQCLCGCRKRAWLKTVIREILHHLIFINYHFYFRKFLESTILQSRGNSIFYHFTGTWFKDLPGVLKVSQNVHIISSVAGISIRSHVLILQLYQHYFAMTLGCKLLEFPNQTCVISDQCFNVIVTFSPK